jgi:serine/threonine-protein kinase
VAFRLLLLTILFLGTWAAPAPADESLRPAVLRSFRDAQTGIRLRYPADWNSQPDVAGTVVAVTAPPEGELDPFQENINVIVEDLSRRGRDFERYTQEAMRQIAGAFRESSILESARTTLDGHPAHRVVFLANMGPLELVYTQVWTVSDGKAYLVTYTASRERYARFLEAAQNIIGSLEIS